MDTSALGGGRIISKAQTIPPLELGRRQLADEAVTALRVVEGLDVIEHGQAGVGPGGPRGAVDERGLIYVSYGPALIIWGVLDLIQRDGQQLHGAVTVAAIGAGLALLLAARAIAARAAWRFISSLLATAIVVVVIGAFSLSIAGDGIGSIVFGSIIALIGTSAIALTAMTRPR